MMAERADHPPRNATDWRELFRCEDRERAIAVTTSIAAMGFDVECEDSGGARAAGCTRGCVEGLPLGDPPYIVHVPAEHLPELGPVLDEIIAEQADFDELLNQRLLSARRFRRTMILGMLIIAMAALALLGLLRV